MRPQQIKIKQMTKRLFILALLFSTLVSCKSETKTDLHQQPELDFVQTFEGTIDNKYPLYAKLQSNGGDLTGNYFYNKIGTDIKVNGTITNDSVFTLNEFDDKGNQVGLWKGKLINKNKISGKWSKPDGSSAADFQLLSTSDNYEIVKREISNSKYLDYTGTYNSPFNDGGISYGVVKIVYKGNKEISFDISVGRQDGCTGQLAGTAKINSSGQAFYSGTGCESLIFNFKNDEVLLKEKNCEHHGMRCFFDGVYRK